MSRTTDIGFDFEATLTQEEFLAELAEKAKKEGVSPETLRRGLVLTMCQEISRVSMKYMKHSTDLLTKVRLLDEGHAAQLRKGMVATLPALESLLAYTSHLEDEPLTWPASCGTMLDAKLDLPQKEKSDAPA